MQVGIISQSRPLATAKGCTRLLQSHQIRISFQQIHKVAVFGHYVLDYLVIFSALLEQVLQCDLWQAQKLGEGIRIEL